MATGTGYFFANAFKKLANKEVDLDTDTIKMMAVSSSYTPDRAAHDYKDDVVANEVTGTNFAAGGLTLASPTINVVAANSWPTARANSTAYVAGDVIRPSTGNGFLYQCITGGTSHSSAPTYPTTIGGTVAEGSGTVVWLCVATSAWVFDGTDFAATTVTISGVRYLVFYDSTPASDATRPLIAYLDLASDQAASAGNFNVTFHANGIAFVLVP